MKKPSSELESFKDQSAQTPVSRRDFLAGIGALTAASCIPLRNVVAADPLYPPRDLSCFDTPLSPAPAEIRIGYASITWGGNDRQAIEDIAALGFHGIQLRSNVVSQFASASEVRDLLDKHQLKLVALSSGDLQLDPAFESDEIAKHVAHAKFLRDAGGLYLQIIDRRPKDRAIGLADYKRLGSLLTELGKRTADLGVSVGYHNHMGSCGERPEAVDEIMQAVDPRYAKLELDIAHYFQGGGNPVKAVEKYADRLLFLHIKDVHQAPAGSDAKSSYEFVELGYGKVDVPAVFTALHKINFRGWAIIELDSVPDKARSPKEAAAINKKYIEEKIGLTV
jgi:inosose dehydratase